MARLVNGADFGAAYMERLSPGSSRFIERLGTPRGIALALYPTFRESVVFIEDDFIEDTISSTRWNLAADGTATTFAWSTGAGGRVAGATGTTDNGYFAINGDVIWSGDKNCGMAIRWQTDIITDHTFEIGFTDALADETLPAVSDVDTPATGNGATDVAVVHLDTDQTLKTAAFVSESTGTAYAAQKVNLGTWAPTAAKWYTTIVQLQGDTAFTATYNTDVAGSPALQANTNKSLTLALEGGTLVRPHFLYGTRSTASKAVLVDFIRVWQDR
jgi:hypothetical protein